MKTTQTTLNRDSAHHGKVNQESHTFFSGKLNGSGSFFSPVIVQPKLNIGSPDNPYERQADRVAEAVVSSPAPVIQQQSMEEEEETLQLKCSECEEEALQMKLDAGQSEGTATRAVSQKVRNPGVGNRLSDSVNSEMSQKMGADFSNVNIHTGPEASRLNQSLGARAFTHGTDVFFNSGEYNPGSREGKRLLAHELTHVVQQNSENIKNSEMSLSFNKVIQRQEDNVVTPGSLNIQAPRNRDSQAVAHTSLGILANRINIKANEYGSQVLLACDRFSSYADSRIDQLEGEVTVSEFLSPFLNILFSTFGRTGGAALAQFGGVLLTNISNSVYNLMQDEMRSRMEESINRWEYENDGEALRSAVNSIAQGARNGATVMQQQANRFVQIISVIQNKLRNGEPLLTQEQNLVADFYMASAERIDELMGESGFPGTSPIETQVRIYRDLVEKFELIYVSATSTLRQQIEESHAEFEGPESLTFESRARSTAEEVASAYRRELRYEGD